MDAISAISPDTFESSDPVKAAKFERVGLDLESRAFGLFEPRIAARILSANRGDKSEDVSFIRKYEDVLKAGMNERKEIVNGMLIADRVGFWKTQLVYHLAVSHLTPLQRKYIVDLMPEIASIFEASVSLSKDDRKKYVDNLESRMLAVFSKPEAFSIFMAIGIQSSVAPVSSPNASLIPWSCNCRWYCSEDGQYCQSISCKATNGCGPFDTWECTGYCGA